MKKIYFATIVLIAMATSLVIGYFAFTSQSNPPPNLPEVGVPDFFVVDSTGQVISTSDGTVRLEIFSEALENETVISICSIKNIYVAGYTIVSVYRLGPEGTLFLTPATLSVKYSSESLPSGLNENELRLFVSQGDGLAEIDDTSADLATHVVSGKISHFSYVYLGAHKKDTEPKAPLIVGKWDRTDGTDKYTFYANGTTRTVIGEEIHYGTWVSDGSDGYKYTLNWEHGPSGKASFIDYITVANDGKSYSGVNNYGDSVHCIGVANEPPSPTIREIIAYSGYKVGERIKIETWWDDPEDDIEFYEWMILSPEGKTVIGEYHHLVVGSNPIPSIFSKS